MTFKVLQQWQADRRARKIQGCLDNADYYRREASRLARAAYDIDCMEQPMRWGRMQNAANWAKHHEKHWLSKSNSL